MPGTIRMKLGTKIPLLFGAAFVLSLAASLSGLLMTARSLIRYEHEVMRQVDDERAVAALIHHFGLQLQEWKDTLLRGSDSTMLEVHRKGYLAHEASVTEGARALQGHLGSRELNADLDAFVDEQRKMAAGYAQGFGKFTDAGYEPSVGDAAVRGLDRVPAELLEQLAGKIAARRAAVAASASLEGRRAVVIAAAVMVVACLAGLAIGVLVARKVVAPLLVATKLAHDVADGDLTKPVQASGHDETASLLRGLARMQDRLRALVGAVRDNATGVEIASTDIAEGNQNLRLRTQKQAQALQVTATAMEQLGATARASAEGAHEASQHAMTARDVAMRGGADVARVVSTMQRINETSRQISEITSIIDGIAFQTNILALNAAVEAARAGDQGRGFTVVAGEVRSLAARSSAAAREIGSLIASSVEQIEEGSRLSHNASRTMEEIVSSIHRVTDLVSQISTASGEQSAGVAQVGHELVRMDESTRQNAALVSESASAANVLQRKARDLVQSVSAFAL